MKVYNKCATTMLLGDSFYNQPSLMLSKALLYKLVCRRLSDAEVAAIPEGPRQHAFAVDGEPIIQARIVETEAYPSGDDKATHSYGGKRTARTEPMFMKPGTAYVYLIYGLYHCVNISAQEPGAAALIRALEPVRGEEWARALRTQTARRKLNTAENGVLAVVRQAPMKSHDIFSGPSKLCQALSINCANFNKHDLTLGRGLWLEEDDVSRQKSVTDGFSVIECARIGLNGYGEIAANQPWRWYVRESLSVSKRDRKAEAASTGSAASSVSTKAKKAVKGKAGDGIASKVADPVDVISDNAAVLEKDEAPTRRGPKRIRAK